MVAAGALAAPTFPL